MTSPRCHPLSSRSLTRWTRAMPRERVAQSRLRRARRNASQPTSSAQRRALSSCVPVAGEDGRSLSAPAGSESGRRPVLVTGMHRSGTTWVGHMLCAGGDFVRVGEPLSPSNRQTILRHTTSDWYTYIHAGNEAPFLRSYRDALRFRVHPLDDVRRARVLSPRDPGRILERWGSF